MAYLMTRSAPPPATYSQAITHSRSFDGLALHPAVARRLDPVVPLDTPNGVDRSGPQVEGPAVSTICVEIDPLPGSIPIVNRWSELPIRCMLAAVRPACNVAAAPTVPSGERSASWVSDGPVNATRNVTSSGSRPG